MNSTSSIEAPRALKGRATLPPWQFYLTASFLGAAAVVWLSPPSTPVALVFMSLAVGAAGACAAALHAVLSALGGRVSRDVAVSDGIRAALEREKVLALRAIKDLQFDVAMRKVSAADAAPMEARLRERAADIMRQLDDRVSLRARIEKDLQQRIGSGLRAQDSGRGTQDSGPEPRALSPAPLVCACGTANDADAKFCKNCGSKL